MVSNLFRSAWVIVHVSDAYNATLRVHDPIALGKQAFMNKKKLFTDNLSIELKSVSWFSVAGVSALTFLWCFHEFGDWKDIWSVKNPWYLFRKSLFKNKWTNKNEGDRLTRFI